MKKSLAVRLIPPFPPSLRFTTPPSSFYSVDLSDHLGIIGRNCSGKRSVLKGIERACVQSGLQVESVNFESHRRIVRDSGNDTVSRVLGGLRDNADIVVRFGLSGVWWRKIKSLSTGEVRKVLLARAVSKNPDVLILDRPFDGLDVKSRTSLLTLLDEVSNTTQQSQARPLVQGIKWRERSPVRIVVATHRPTHELPQRIKALVTCEGYTISLTDRTPAIITDFEKKFTVDSAILPKRTNESERRREEHSTELLEPLLDIQRLTVFPTQKPDEILEGKNPTRPLLDRVSWCVHPRDVWWLQGENGASKSVLLSCALGPATLLRLASAQHATREWTVEEDPDADRRRKRPPTITCTDSVEMVSTELHMSLLESEELKNISVRQMLEKKAKGDLTGLATVMHDLALDRKDCLSRSFRELSIGEQKLVMVAGAVVAKPKLLILDEACQSLDLEHRTRVAQVVDKVCTSSTTDTACIFVTHYEDELPRVISHRLVLSQGKVMSRGQFHVSRQYYQQLVRM